jgi:hypothetical protein
VPLEQEVFREGESGGKGKIPVYMLQVLIKAGFLFATASDLRSRQ